MAAAISHVGGRGDLRAVAEVDLVAVVLRGVVARGDHHARGAAQLADREGEQRRRAERRQAQGAQAGAAADRGRLLREARRAVPRVVADDHAGRRRPADRVEQVRRQPGRRAAHRGHVHPRRTGAERAAQARGAEGQAACEARLELGVGAAVDQRAQLRLRLRVGVVGDPRRDPLSHRLRHRVRNVPVQAQSASCAPSTSSPRSATARRSPTTSCASSSSATPATTSPTTRCPPS